ncbi:glycosyltransferase family 2 protein [Nitrosarchaeum sp.]|uniref:glycosyltransferase family 2 protein n=1 Tax=Nitrosarchaeum sp. TaxID=2026886 RepID=UPI00247CD0D0|nr:glycosyltransferase family 2 protein [Nitrosarchaeum sp.]MCV0411898.1 glycosyltransferase family 2 protein [Nitrosarchaeum sp.]
MKEPLISIIILNYNAGKLLDDCINSIFQQAYKNIEVIIVDNLSTDNSHIECKKKFPDIILIENKKNLGYCGGNNVGIKAANGEFVIILNPDTIVEKRFVYELLNAYENKGRGLYQPKILSIEDKKIIQSTGNMIHIFGFGFARDKGKMDLEQYTEISQVGYASGTCLFSSKTIFEELNYFDEFLFLYHDDLDIGWRAAQKGIKSFFVPKAVIFHAESYSLKWSKAKFYWLERNRKYCLLTHFSNDTLKKMKINLVLTEILVWVFYLVKGYLRVKINAEKSLRDNKDFIKGKQIEIEKNKIVSDIELINSFPDKIEVPKNVSDGIEGKIFLKILEFLSKQQKQKFRT